MAGGAQPTQPRHVQNRSSLQKTGCSVTASLLPHPPRGAMLARASAPSEQSQGLSGGDRPGVEMGVGGLEWVLLLLL